MSDEIDKDPPYVFRRNKGHGSIADENAPVYFRSPAYEIKNFDRDMTWFERTGTLLFRLFKPNDENNLWRRLVRNYKSPYYITANDKWDLFLLTVMMITFIITVIVFFRSHTLKVTQVYEFTNSEDAKDPIKQKQLDEWNSTFQGEAWLAGRAALAAIPVIIALWNMFKRTTKPNKANRISSVIEQQNKASRNLRAVSPY